MCQYPNYCTSPSTHFVWNEFAIGICCHLPLSHCTWCILFNSPPLLPPPKKKKEKKKTICIRITFNFTWVLTTFTKTIMHLVYSPKFALPLPERNWKQSLYITHLFIYCTFFGGEGEINKVHYGLCVNGELQQKRLLCIFFWGGGVG